MRLFPGGVGVTELKVYDWEASDGQCGGSPHMHIVSTEGYVVIEGSGAVETLSSAGFDTHPLAVGDILWFTPGTVHRLINAGGLRLIAVMANSGLPEAGDAIFTFPPAVLDEPSAYAASASLSSETGSAVAARARRDLAMQGYLELREGGAEALAHFQRRAVSLVASKISEWSSTWESTVLAEAEETREHLERLPLGDIGGLEGAVVRRAEPAGEELRHGMCGWLRTWRWPSGEDPVSVFS